MHALKTLGRALWAGWKRFAHALGVVNRTVLLTLFYFIIIDLINLVLRAMRKDLLDRRLGDEPTYWHPKPARTGPSLYEHQF